MGMMSEEDATAILYDCGIGPGTAWGLCWRLRVVDGLSDEDISRELGVKVGSVWAYLSKVNQRLREHQVYSLPEVGPEPVEEPDAEDVAIAERCLTSSETGAMFDAFRNRRDRPDHAPDIALRSPVDTPLLLGDRPPFLSIPPPRGHNRKWREYLRGGPRAMQQ